MRELLWRAVGAWLHALWHAVSLLGHPLVFATTVRQGLPAIVGVQRLLDTLIRKGGIVVCTPKEQPLMRSHIVGLGDVTVQVVDSTALTAALMQQHQSELYSRLQVLEQLSQLSRAAHALLALTPFGYGVWQVLCAACAGQATAPVMLSALVKAPLCSALISVLFGLLLRGIAWLLRRRLGL